MTSSKGRMTEIFGKVEPTRRAEGALRAAFNTPPRPQFETKLGKTTVKRKKSLRAKVK